MKSQGYAINNVVNIAKNAVKSPRNVLPLLMTSTTKPHLRAFSLHKQSHFKNILKYSFINFHIYEKEKRG